MLSAEKRKALQELIGAERAKDFEQSLAKTEKSARASGTTFKTLAEPEQSVDDMIAAAFLGADGLDATSEKCTPGTKDGKYKADAKAKKAEDDDEMDDDEDMKAEDDGEDDDSENDDEAADIESLLSEDEIAMIADAVAKRLAGDMKEMKMMMSKGYGRKSYEGDTSGLVDTLKAYTDTQGEIIEELVKTLEETNTRLKALEANLGTGHTPSTSRGNTVSNVAAEEWMRGLTPEQVNAGRGWNF